MDVFDATDHMVNEDLFDNANGAGSNEFLVGIDALCSPIYFRRSYSVVFLRGDGFIH